MMKFLLLLATCCIFCIDALAEPVTYPADQPATRLIVYVNGIRSSARETWTNSDTKTYWPEILRKDPLFENSDVYVYDYKSGLNVDSATIGDIADQMAAELEDGPKIKKYSDVVFIAHSMGGVIVRKYLLEQSQMPDRGILASNRIKGLYLFSTPMNGSTVANLGSGIFTSKTLWQLGTSNNPDSFLNSLRTDWIKAGLGTEIKSDCGFETKGVVNLFFWSKRVVEPSSAEPLCNTGFTGLPDRDHGEVVKPENAAAYPHLLVRQWYKRIFGEEKLGRGAVVIASCNYDQYGPKTNAALATSLFNSNLAHYVSFKLPADWSKDAVPLLWRGSPPKLIVIHYSCFQNKQGDDFLEERRIDFNRFLADLAPTKIKVVTYSRAFYRGFEKQNITKANIASYRNRIRYVSLNFENERRDAEFAKLAEQVKSLIEGN